MRTFWIAIPTALVFAGTGLLMLMEARKPAPQQDLGINFDQPRHLVTQQMEVETAAMANRAAPVESGEDGYGKAVDLGGKSPRPAFVLFIKDGCPCSIDAQPLFNRLAQKYEKQIDFRGVIDADGAEAKRYATQFKVPFPVVADAKLKIIHDYGAKSSVYSALVARNGHIVKMWPGYSAGFLKEMNATFAKAVAMKPTPFDPQYAPLKKATGCSFVLP